MFIYLFILFLLWLCFGSFSTVLISRWQSGKSGIMTGRSECPKCGHILSARELFPFFSWILQWGKCHNCQSPISVFYPLSELFMGLLFAWSGWISLRFGYTWYDMMWWIFLFWTFVTGVYILYDLRYMEIPDQIMVPGILITAILLLLGYISIDHIYLFDFSSYTTFHTFLTDHISSAIFIYSFFFLQILIPGTIFLIQQRDYKNLLRLLLSYFTFPFTVIIDFFRNNHTTGASTELTIPTWIGWGDLRIAIFIGLTLWGIHTLSTLLIAYIIGSIIGISLLIITKISDKEISHEVPFGPFLGAGWILSLTFYQEILDYVHILYI